MAKIQTKHKAIAILVVAAILFSVGAWYKPYVWATWVSGTVTEKIAKTGEVPNKILVRVDGGDEVVTFVNEDISSRAKWDSGDIQANLQVGEHYNFKVVGRRIHMWSSYQNIVKYTKDKDGEE